MEKMKVVLAEEEVKLKEADDACGAMLGNLEISSLEAKREKEAVNKIKEACEADAARISMEKKEAEEDLAKAQPFVDEANGAIDSITAPDLTELKGLGKPSDIIKLVFDCVLLLKMEPVHRVTKVRCTRAGRCFFLRLWGGVWLDHCRRVGRRGRATLPTRA